MKVFTLREARNRKGWTQVELATKSGVGQAVISLMETGRYTHPRFATVVKLAAALDIDPRALRFGQREAVAS